MSLVLVIAASMQTLDAAHSSQCLPNLAHRDRELAELAPARLLRLTGPVMAQLAVVQHTSELFDAALNLKSAADQHLTQAMSAALYSAAPRESRRARERAQGAMSYEDYVSSRSQGDCTRRRNL